MTRRRVILAAAGALAAAALPLAWRRQPASPVVGAPEPARADERFTRPLRLPGADGLAAEIRLNDRLELVARAGLFALLPGRATEILHFASAGRANPLLCVERGARVDVDLVNALDEPTTLHWHGLAVDEASDGSGLHAVAPGERRNVRFEVRNRGGLYWYHAHPHGRTGYQLQRGLAGLLLVEDEEERALRDRLGLEFGANDVTLMLADKQIDERNAIVYRDGADDWIGNRALVNWTPEPYLDVAPDLHRFRIANVANARMLRLAFTHGDEIVPMRLIGTDGGLLERAWPVDDLFLGPAQRADVLVDLGALPTGARVRMRSLDYSAMENEDESGGFAADPMSEHPGAMRMGEPLDFMELRVMRARGTSRGATTIPEQLCTIDPVPDTRGWPERKFRLRIDAQGRWLINDWNFHLTGHEPVFTVKRGAREVWEIRNAMTSMPHPIHVHGFQFRVVSRSISPPDIRARAVHAGGLGPQDLGYSDTVVVWPGEIVRIALDFAQPFRGPQRYMFHCHNLEHEDAGMMIIFAVDD